MSQQGVSSYSEAVRQLMNVCAHTAKATRLMRKLCQGNLLGLEHATKIQYISRSGEWAEKVYKSLSHKGGQQASHPVVVGILLASEQDYKQALQTLAGPHVSIIAAIKYNAHVITTTKSIKRGESTNAILNNALRAVNCVNAIWYTMTHITEFLWDIARFLPEGDRAREDLLQLRKRISAAVATAEDFSTNSRLLVAQECITKRLVVPSSKQFRGITPDVVTEAGPVIRSEVVFKHKCKTLSKISKHQPLRLSIFGNVVVLTVSKLSSETLAVPPRALSEVTAQILPSLPDNVFRLTLGPKSHVTLRCKMAAHRDVWVNFFNDSAAEDLHTLYEKREAFHQQLARPAHPKLAQRPSMAELSLFNETRKTTAPGAQAWGLEQDLLEEEDSEPQTKTLTELLERGMDSSIAKDVVQPCSLPSSRCASPMMRTTSPSATSSAATDRYTPTFVTGARDTTASPLPIGGRSGTPARMSSATPTPSPMSTSVTTAATSTRATPLATSVSAPATTQSPVPIGVAGVAGGVDSEDPDLARALAESLMTHEQEVTAMNQQEQRDVEKAINLSQWETFESHEPAASATQGSSSSSHVALSHSTSPCNDPWQAPVWMKLNDTASPALAAPAATTAPKDKKTSDPFRTVTSFSAERSDACVAKTEKAPVAMAAPSANTRPVVNATTAEPSSTTAAATKQQVNTTEDETAADSSSHRIARRIIPVKPIRQTSDFLCLSKEEGEH
ncbi:hypothetical protein PTSG_04376 [Salpingoeca rosetta]|uniref:Uncharacterized protein n=1 Tax=Salpingoeca rosetta (strain ATCC 50818 / BSB-021) TaxID=946362 RepID=F2U8D3_SALR5|nr:uncharacterized protein PTSG_04376 [Salpingoeca rosetta]EGD72641.1 hypothetical protein PTSG_04376 [Salpingoeca rosetta]|eukprot:XP_004994464.1 hypothetical protein PTSG_04376 [Salpingoeca rosetta]